MPRQVNKIPRVCQQCGTEFLAERSEVKRGGGHFCSRKCYHTSRFIPIEVQFQWGIGGTNENGCILWSGIKDSMGRGVIYSTTRLPQRIFLASRIAWEIMRGPIPDGLCILHHCDNPLCINSEHLFLGTQLENIDDMARKGRQANRRLTDEQIREIRSRYATSGISQQQLADEYGVHQTCISSIVRLKRWKYA